MESSCSSWHTLVDIGQEKEKRGRIRPSIGHSGRFLARLRPCLGQIRPNLGREAQADRPQAHERPLSGTGAAADRSDYLNGVIVQLQAAGGIAAAPRRSLRRERSGARARSSKVGRSHIWRQIWPSEARIWGRAGAAMLFDATEPNLVESQVDAASCRREANQFLGSKHVQQMVNNCSCGARGGRHENNCLKNARRITPADGPPQQIWGNIRLFSKTNRRTIFGVIFGRRLPDSAKFDNMWPLHVAEVGGRLPDLTPNMRPGVIIEQLWGCLPAFFGRPDPSGGEYSGDEFPSMFLRRSPCAAEAFIQQLLYMCSEGRDTLGWRFFRRHEPSSRCSSESRGRMRPSFRATCPSGFGLIV